MMKLTVTFRNFAKAVTSPAVTTIELVTEGTLIVPASRIHTVLQTLAQSIQCCNISTIHTVLQH